MDKLNPSLPSPAGRPGTPAAAWFHAEPSPDAAHIKDQVAFWRGVRVEA